MVGSIILSTAGVRQTLENRPFEVRKLSSQKDQFVNLNHPGIGGNIPECRK